MVAYNHLDHTLSKMAGTGDTFALLSCALVVFLVSVRPHVQRERERERERESYGRG